MKTYKGRGIVLHTLKYGDTSMVAYLLTDVGGRRSYMVQGVRSRSGRGSKLALFQPMFPVEFEGLESPRQQMDRFKEVRAGFVLQSLPFDVRKSTMALFMAEFCTASSGRASRTGRFSISCGVRPRRWTPWTKGCRISTSGSWPT